MVSENEIFALDVNEVIGELLLSIRESQKL